MNNGVHIAYKDGLGLCGTAKYCSLSTHLGITQSRRDDMESVGHVLIYFLRNGLLPWSGIKKPLMKKKMENTPISELCEDLLPEIMMFMEYCRNLKFDATPDYEYLIDLLKSCLHETST